MFRPLVALITEFAELSFKGPPTPTQFTATSDFLSNIYLNTNLRKLKIKKLQMEEKCWKCEMFSWVAVLNLCLKCINNEMAIIQIKNKLTSAGFSWQFIHFMYYSPVSWNKRIKNNCHWKNTLQLELHCVFRNCTTFKCFFS